MEILNVWGSTKERKKYYSEDNLVYQIGDFRIFKQWNNSYIYAYKNIAINCLAGLNIGHLNRVAEKLRPSGKYSPDHFLYDRAQENLKLGLELIK